MKKLIMLFKLIFTSANKPLIEDFEPAEQQCVNTMSSDLINALKSLGYNDKEINHAVANLNQQSNELSDLISESIKIIARGESFG